MTGWTCDAVGKRNRRNTPLRVCYAVTTRLPETKPRRSEDSAARSDAHRYSSLFRNQGAVVTSMTVYCCGMPLTVAALDPTIRVVAVGDWITATPIRLARTCYETPKP